MESKLLQSVENMADIGKFVIGNDLVFVPEFRNSLTDAFRGRVFTEQEKSYCDRFDGESLLRYASTWAAKEATYKAIKQLYPEPLFFNKIEITRDKIAGKPTAILHSDKLKQLHISLTISHDGDYAWAIAVIAVNEDF